MLRNLLFQIFSYFHSDDCSLQNYYKYCNISRTFTEECLKYFKSRPTVKEGNVISKKDSVAAVSQGLTSVTQYELNLPSKSQPTIGLYNFEVLKLFPKLSFQINKKKPT